MTSFFLIITAYLIGSIPTGILLARFYGGKDITREGSGNIGATNVHRVVGKKAGVLTLIGDSLKGVIPLFITLMIAGDNARMISLTAFFAFLGHLYPLFNKFRGGKGVATALGVFFVISPLATLAAGAIFAVIVYFWRYVSLGSIVAAAIMPVLMALFTASGSYIILAVIIGSLVIFRHSANIRRLLEGKENRLGSSNSTGKN